MESEPRFYIGQHLDILDSVNKWCNAEVLRVNGPEIYICYTGWSSKYNEWLLTSSNRILTQWEAGKQIKLNNRVDVKHPFPKQWLEARVIEIDEDNVKVHFNNYHSKYDIWVDVNNKDQVAPIGSHSKAYGVGKKRNKETFKISQEILNKLKNLHKEFKQSLKSRKLVIKEVGGDGNCLFRTISDQLYGTEQHHSEIRSFVMDYILEEKTFFQNYILQDIGDYVQRKRMLGCWGDDVQLQAISQIYNRPIQVYVSDQKPIRTFHQDNDENIFPIRVAYEGSCHYNSIKEEGHQNSGVMQDEFPTWENFVMKNLKLGERKQDIYRNQFASKVTIDEALNYAFNGEIKENQHQLQNQMLKMTETNSLLDQIQSAEIKQIKLIQQQNRLNDEMRRIQQMQMQEIKKQSLKEHEKKINNSLGFQQQYWVQNIREQGFSDDEILFAIQAKGNNPDEVLNYLYDNF